MANLNKIIDELSKLTVVEAAELSKQLEKKWGVTAVTAAAAAPATGCVGACRRISATLRNTALAGRPAAPIRAPPSQMYPCLPSWSFRLSAPRGALSRHHSTVDRNDKLKY